MKNLKYPFIVLFLLSAVMVSADEQKPVNAVVSKPILSGKPVEKIVPFKKPGSKPKMVRVAIVRNARELYLGIEGQFSIFDDVAGQALTRAPRMAKTHVRLLEKGIMVGMDVYPTTRLAIEATKDAGIIVNNRRFRGNLLLIRTKENRLTAVNSINIEDYIKGVLYHEVSHYWPMETLKAQAVATRTYALYSLAGKSKDYDVTNDIYSQVYGGKESERYRTGLAVERTENQVLVYKGKVVPAYFHATCAGMTEDAKELWNIDLMPLRGVPCSFCQDSPHMQWKRNFRLKDIQDNLNSRGYKIGAIASIAVIERNKSNRILGLKIIDRDGQELLISGKDFRDVIGPNVLKSNNYDIQMKGYYVDFIGKGWGHGVGMCQWGARGMANQQFTYKQILSYYYPQSQMVDYHELDKIPVKKIAK